ncbi:MAG: SRPBCC family protein [Alphaproteobacteria bacterium]|nr:SRPBCC family protein [Alphaproteobacteria bacterium]
MTRPDHLPAHVPWFPCEPVGDDHAERAPVVFPHTVELGCSAEELFAVFEDPESWPRWAPGIGKVEWTSPTPYGPGTTRTVTFWGGTQVFEVFHTFDPPHRMGFHFVGTTEEIWRSFSERYEVESTGPDSCRLTWTVAYEPIGRFGFLHPVLKPLMRFALGSYMTKLRAYVKAHTAG